MSATLFTKTTSWVKPPASRRRRESRDVSANEPIDVEQHDHAIGNGYEAADIVGGAAGAEIGRGLHFLSVDVDDIRDAVDDDAEVPAARRLTSPTRR